MKNKAIVLSVLFALVLIGGYVLGSISQTVDNVLADEKDDLGNTITVSGEGVIKVKPDIAYINIGVETIGKNSQDAQIENKNKMTNIMSKIKSFKIKDDDIKTIEYNIIAMKEYDREKGKSVITGYMVRNVVQITIRDIENIGKIIDRVSEVGANLITNITFSVKDKEKYYLEALKMAMEKAKSKGVAIADTFGVKLDIPYKVIELSDMNYSIVGGYRDTFTYLKEGAVNTPISQGELEIRAKVNVIYKY
ncbi:SIMPL domain-containing protein [Caloranaerobacter sp. DY30410]|uniref:SIMPL domain-containing protein n=1 Tax=Caloranaerobacter sp. DY30410 TaxID=3238305 RepID=UPI003CFCD312